MKSVANNHPSKTADLVGQVADEFFKAVEAGQEPSVDEYVFRYPEIAAILRDVLPTLTLINASVAGGDSNAQSTEDLSNKTLGDFRLIREIGRGGMGIVYKAEQISLRRTVAIKVLPFAGVLDEKQLQRFKNEARAAATLEHPHIVPVYSVGCERGVHYYAMRFIDGQSLADVVQAIPAYRASESEVQIISGNRAWGPADSTENKIPNGRADAPSPSQSSRGDRSAAGLSNAVNVEIGRQSDFSNEDRLPGTCSPSSETRPDIQAVIATDADFNGPAYFRNVARLGIQAAEALTYAHEQGILHRDIKPGNLLIDVHGNLWVADFGLARLGQDAGVTVSGDVLGTLRYMSPEQALGKCVLDERSDVYSLGITLYEMLVLRPAFSGHDRQEILRRIAVEDPKPPRQVNPRIPLDLETIVLKAIRKSPEERYATAKELASDLRSLLENKPIAARPPTRRERAAKWMKRHPAGVRATAVAILATVAVLAASIGWIIRDRAARQVVLSHLVTKAIEESKTQYHAGKFAEAMSAMKRADGFVTSGGGAELRQLVQEWRSELETAERLEQIRLGQAGGWTDIRGAMITQLDEGQNSRTGADQSYRDEFRRYGLDLDNLEAEESSKRIARSPVKDALIAALDDWFQITRQRRSNYDTHSSGTLAVLNIARLADPDIWRNRLRDAIEHDDASMLAKLAADKDLIAQPPPTALLLAEALHEEGRAAEATGILRQAQQRHPDDFWIDVELANWLSLINYPNLDESIGYLRAAVALRPDSAGAHLALGLYLNDEQRLAEAEAAMRNAIRLRPDYSDAYHRLVEVLNKEGKYIDAEDLGREFVRRFPNDGRAHQDLAMALANQMDSGHPSKHDEAVIEFLRALDQLPDESSWCSPRKRACCRIANWSDVFDAVAKRRPHESALWIGRAHCHLLRSEWTDAVADYEKVIHSLPACDEESLEYCGLLLLTGQNDAYQQFCRTLAAQGAQTHQAHSASVLARSLALGPADAVAPSRLVEWGKEAFLGHRWDWHVLGLAYYRAGEYDRAITHLDKSLADSGGSDGSFLAQNWYVRAMAQHRLGHTEEAKTCMTEAAKCMESARQHSAQAPTDWIEANVLEREAETVLQSPSHSHR